PRPRSSSTSPTVLYLLRPFASFLVVRRAPDAADRTSAETPGDPRTAPGGTDSTPPAREGSRLESVRKPAGAGSHIIVVRSVDARNPRAKKRPTILVGPRVQDNKSLVRT